MSLHAQEPPFGTFRSFFWPVFFHETKKVLPMFLMIFLICFNYSILRNMKDALVVTASGAEVIPFIKVWAMLPMAVFLSLLFARLTNRYSQEKVFYLMTGGFLSFYLLFAFIFYPLRDVLHPHAFADQLELMLPSGCKGLISMIRHWTFTGFYVMCELWGTVVLNILFWGFANEVTKIEEAKRFYSVFGIGGNLAAFSAGQAAIFFSQPLFSHLPFFANKSDWEQTQILLVSLVVISGIIVMLLFKWLNQHLFNNASFDALHTVKQPKKEKTKLSFRDNFTYLSNSKYLLCIAALVVAYNLVINLVEVVWKDQLSQLYPDPADFNNYLNGVTSSLGIISTILAVLMAKIISSLGWTRTALITPIVMLITSLGFFSFFLFQDSLSGVVMSVMGTTPLAITVFFGAAQNCLSKATKYSIFDTTKEMTYIPLSHESKLKGKAAIDGVVSRLGKSSGSLIHQSLLMFFSTLSASAPYVAVILIGAIFVWIYAVKQLGHLFQEKVGTTAEFENNTPKGELLQGST